MYICFYGPEPNDSNLINSLSTFSVNSYHSKLWSRGINHRVGPSISSKLFIVCSSFSSVKSYIVKSSTWSYFNLTNIIAFNHVEILLITSCSSILRWKISCSSLSICQKELNCVNLFSWSDSYSDNMPVGFPFYVIEEITSITPICLWSWYLSAVNFSGQTFLWRRIFTSYFCAITF